MLISQKPWNLFISAVTYMKKENSVKGVNFWTKIREKGHLAKLPDEHPQQLTRCHLGDKVAPGTGAQRQEMVREHAILNNLQMKSYSKFVTFGLYSAFLACNAIFFKSSLHPRFTVDTMFLKRLKTRTCITTNMAT